MTEPTEQIEQIAQREIETRSVVERYFAAWTAAQERETRALLADDLEAATPLNSYRSAEPFVAGLMRVAGMLRGARIVASVVEGDRAALLYDFDLPAPVGTLRAAWFLRVEGGKIRSVQQQYDATGFRQLFGKAPG
jgi:hypothetical protein